MAYKSFLDGVIFVEGGMKGASQLAHISYDKEAFYHQQLKNLTDIKKQLAGKAKQLGANAVIDFKYGQKSTTALRSMFLAFDDNVNWYAEGVAALLDEDTYREIVAQLSRDEND